MLLSEIVSAGYEILYVKVNNSHCRLQDAHKQENDIPQKTIDIYCKICYNTKDESLMKHHRKVLTS